MKLAINLPLLIIGSAVFGIGLADGRNWWLLPGCIFLSGALFLGEWR
ncbi:MULTISPECIES: hypothetical protein [unclassified Pseudomonas]|nr:MULTISPECIES: hypothetical protein [unclassified Pseudomonas]QIH09016.1 hypothetical protein ATY02_20920 [Pseudomonas sp. BIOMIG1BAC]